MKYQPPYGITADPNAPYVNGDPSIGRQGSIPPAAAFEYPMREIVGVIEKSQFNPTDADLLQMAKSVRSQRMNYSEDSGGVNTFVVAYDPPLGSYTIGLVLHVRIRNSVTGPCTINAGAGTVNVIRADGSVIQEGDLPAGCVAAMIFDGTSFQVMNFFGKGVAAAPPDSGGGDVVNNIYITKLPYVVDSSTTPGQIVAPFNPAFTTLVPGDAMLVKLANTSPGLTTIRVNALPPKYVLANDSSHCMQGDYVAGDVKLFIFDGSYFYIDPNPLITAPVTLPVPSSTYPNPAYTMALLQRKLIANNASVTIQLGVGNFGDIGIAHHDGDKIIIAGTMIGPTPDVTEYIPSNSTYNIQMLQSRYGTQIYSNGAGLCNYGHGAPICQNILIIGSVPGCYGVALDPDPQIENSIRCYNVNVWGCAQGFYGHASARLSGCVATSCGIGFGSVNGGSLHMSNCTALACSSINAMCINNSTMIFGGGNCNYSGYYGFYSANGSVINLNYTTAIGNVFGDAIASNGSIITFDGSNVGTTSPARGVEGNMSSVCG
jgi:hypothetical protein